MAVGDPVNGIGLLATDFEFRPAAGVSVLITSCFENYGNNPRMTNGVVISYPTASGNGDIKNIKVFYNNTNWLYISAAAATYNSYSGIVIQ